MRLYAELELPDTLGELMKLAIKDARDAERKGVHLDMSVWLSSDEEAGECLACLAGSVMLRAGLALPATGSAHPNEWEHLTARKLHALDKLRIFDIPGAARNVYTVVDDRVLEKARALSTELFGLGWTETEWDTAEDSRLSPPTTKFWETMEYIRDRLIEEGI